MTPEPDPAGLGEILATSELARRGSRPSNHRVESHVMTILAQTIADRPRAILQVLADIAVQLCGAGSSGISRLERSGGEEVFRWAALSGLLQNHAGRIFPRHFSPSGIAVDRRAVQLFVQPARHFTALANLEPAIAEGLVMPFFQRAEALGTIWIVSHDPKRKFDSEDARLLAQLGAFTAAGLQAIRAPQSAR